MATWRDLVSDPRYHDLLSAEDSPIAALVRQSRGWLLDTGDGDVYKLGVHRGVMRVAALLEPAALGRHADATDEDQPQRPSRSPRPGRTPRPPHLPAGR